MSPRYDDEWVAGLLDADGRLGGTSPQDLLARVGLRRRQTVIDYGCGPGFLTLAAAAIVGPLGRVYAVDIEKKMLDLVDRRATSAGHRNILTVFSSGQRVPLSDQIADWAICVQVLHCPQQLADRIDMVGDIARLLAPEGRVLIVNWIPQTGDDGSRLSAAETQGMLRQAGFEPDEPQPLGEKQYTITARRLAAQRVPG